MITNIYFKYENGTLYFANEEGGSYVPVSEETMTADVPQGGEINWYAGPGMKNLKKIKCSGACFCTAPHKISRRQWQGMIATSTPVGAQEKYDVKFKADNDYVVLVDPKVRVKQGPAE